ncbi:hypothetical protein [Actinacidiphila sp. ITFR-21]|uniref:hypothetical protein n=1 Tax=Actinacidiphila sp. ITFR-21 TaxID=3075199 RepID=UPI00288BBD67|nr:hypothetical protein [Streptomyces sp. ITFR-21]WNI20230.1 hypothetical protein RLT57_32310 [Streptomyces sp. ITFR-21]
MTKNGSNGGKTRVRTRAARMGLTYRQSARASAQAAKTTEDLRTQRVERWRAAARESGELADIRDYYLGEMLQADLPDSVMVCLYVLTDYLGTAAHIDPQAVRCTMSELAEATGLDIEAACLSVYLAEAHGWVTGFHDNEARLTVPGDDVGMYERFLSDQTSPVRNAALYERLRAEAFCRAEPGL